MVIMIILATFCEVLTLCQVPWKAPYKYYVNFNETDNPM